jgi:hypothetical protein
MDQVKEPTVESEADKVLKEAQKIREEYGRNEGNIPVHSDYWNLMNRYKGLVARKLNH